MNIGDPNLPESHPGVIGVGRSDFVHPLAVKHPWLAEAAKSLHAPTVADALSLLRQEAKEQRVGEVLIAKIDKVLQDKWHINDHSTRRKMALDVLDGLLDA